jgi:hypothetical protein
MVPNLWLSLTASAADFPLRHEKPDFSRSQKAK